jgi:Uma2 family endonuclease
MIADKTRMTAQEYFQLPETNARVNLLDGELIISPSSTPLHQERLSDTMDLLNVLIQPIGGRVFLSPLEIHFDEYNVAQPDTFWIAPDSRAVVTELRVEGPPDLAVEVLSADSVKLDRVKKFHLYEKYGVREYWIIDPNGVVDVFSHKDGHFELVGIFDSEDTFHSPLLGQPVEVKRLFLF